ncbi:MAG TPA: hypothetical protein VL651_03505, partial [Bacteroidia bacterium]|nr:hypothetical protein [Bacteroidia bacterium]
GVNHDRVNTITSTFSAKIDPTETSGVQVFPADTVAAIVTYSGIHPWYLHGYFGNQTIHIGPEESFFSVFHKVRSGSLGLDSLKMSLTLDNYVGMDSRVTINNIWSRNTHTGNSVYLANSIIGTPININRGMLTNSDPPVTPDHHLFVFDNSNSNAKALLENVPDELGYDVTLLTNPLGNVSANNDFLYTDYGIDAKLNVEMPLNFFADQLVIADTTNIDFSSIKNKENIEKGTLTLHAQNDFPFSASVQFFLVDANNNVLDSLVAPPGTIVSGITGMLNNYLVATGFASSEVRIPLTATQTQALLNSTHIIMRAIYDTNSAPTYVKIFDTNRLDLQLSADFDYLVN